MAELPYTSFNCVDSNGDAFVVNVELRPIERTTDEGDLMLAVAAYLDALPDITVTGNAISVLSESVYPV